MFDFDYVDYQPGWFSSHDSKEMARDLGRGDAEKAFPRAKYKYVRDEPVTLQGWDGYALDIEDAEGAVVMMRTYIVKDRLYRMLVTAKYDTTTRAAATRFLNSLRLSETRQAPRAWSFDTPAPRCRCRAPSSRRPRRPTAIRLKAFHSSV